MEDPEDFIRKKLPSWARWEPDVNEEEEKESDPILWVKVVGAEDEEGYFWMSEHGLKSAYHDMLIWRRRRSHRPTGRGAVGRAAGSTGTS